MEALRRAPHFGRPERLSAAQRQELVRLLKEGALAAGFSTELWTAPRIAQLIQTKFSVKLVPPRSGGCSDGWVGACSGRRARRANARSAVRTWKAKRWPEPRSAARQGRVIVFIDESSKTTDE